MIEIRPATDADILAYFGKPRPQTVKAWVAVKEGQIIGIAGAAYHRLVPCYLWADWKPEMRRHPRDMIRGGRIVLEAFRGTRLWAAADPSEPGAAKLLARLGLELVGETKGMKLFMWG